MGIKLKGQPLRIIFLEYLISVGIVLFLSLGLVIMMFNTMYSLGFILPADYTENQIYERKNAIANTETFDKNLIPDNASYLLISKDGNIITSSMSKDEEDRAIRYYNNEKVYNTPSYSYMEILRSDGYCIIQYSVKPYFTNNFMAKYFPNVNAVYLSIIILVSLLNTLVVTIVWAKYLVKQLSPIFAVSKKISEQTLDFELHYSRVKEFNEVLFSLEKMRNALQESLIKEWLQEENKQKQISALIHDLKTPVSIVQGNAELLKKTSVTEDQSIYIDYILRNSNRISEYIKTLLIMNKNSNATEFQPQLLVVKAVSEQLVTVSKELMSINSNNLKTNVVVEDGIMSVDLKLLERALQNVLANSIENNNGIVILELNIKTVDEFLEISILDNGKGFSDIDLIHAKEQFYRGDYSRHSATNYGIGLFITEQIIKLHGGSVILKNREACHGAEVIFRLPIQNNK
jgi:subtilin biosynthesis sensor protein spaK, putative